MNQSTRKLRRVHEEGHNRKFLMIVDETPECESAAYFAACRARNTGSKVLLLNIVEPEDFQHWLSVEALHREEGEQKAEAIFRMYRIKLKSWGFEDIVAEERVEYGEAHEMILKTIDEDEDVSFLVLGASTSSDGPGKLVSWISGSGAGTFPIPIVIIPGALEFTEIEALS